ncbi:FAD-dependent oxidoreductase [Phyllobacterium sp. SB3]|uniref:NAD(P)/FAD-dependent oxidoreductase n=1 Tax=Phyllobacterium sp. SB3 TaxID=3156073 RepID=UPI0032AF09CD
MSTSSDVLIIGAGIVGSSAAYFLARSGLSTTLVDRVHPAGGPTGKSSALLHAFYLMPELSRLALRGREILVGLPEIANGNSFVTQVGMMWVCGEDSSAAWTGAAERIRGQGGQIETLSPQEFTSAVPAFSDDRVALALWEPEFGYADAFGATNALANGARNEGATLLQNTSVKSLAVRNGKVTGVVLEDGTTLNAGNIIMAAGPWTRALLATAGLQLPLHVERHPMAVLDAGGKARSIMPFAWCDDINCNYARPDNDGVILAGSWAGGGTGLRHETAERPRSVTDPDHYMEGVEEAESVEILKTFTTRVPAMLDLGIRPGYAGLYDMSPDDLPIIGKMPGIEGLYISAGSSGHGFKTGPAVGEALAELLIRADESLLKPFSPERFGGAA